MKRYLFCGSRLLLAIFSEPKESQAGACSRRRKRSRITLCGEFQEGYLDGGGDGRIYPETAEGGPDRSSLPPYWDV
ncbi:MAG: hypothetical protein C4576_32715 [Desulfobacteraceae bacterium]|nr:MAG: hypothetical protein C4576_32715 [Desulfobacteraceae bacterium]